MENWAFININNDTKIVNHIYRVEWTNFYVWEFVNWEKFRMNLNKSENWVIKVYKIPEVDYINYSNVNKRAITKIEQPVNTNNDYVQTYYPNMHTNIPINQYYQQNIPQHKPQHKPNMPHLTDKELFQNSRGTWWSFSWQENWNSYNVHTSWNAKVCIWWVCN